MDEVKLCDPCFKKEPAIARQAYWFPSGIPMCDDCYSHVCGVCQRNWAQIKRMGSKLVWVETCEDCEAARKREQQRRETYNQHLSSKEWWEAKKELRRQSVSEHGRAVCSKCGVTEFDNKQTYGEGLHGHHTTYERFGQEKTEDLELLCSRCHAWEHGNSAPKPLRNYERESIRKLLH
jgi:hypothetical protein